MSEDEDASGMIKTECSDRKTVVTYISRLNYEVKLLVSRGHDSILILCDRFSKMLHFIAITEKITAEYLVRLFRNNV